MIKVSTKPRSFEFELDGEVVSVPLCLTVEEYRAFGKASSSGKKASEVSDSSEMPMDEAIDMSISIYEWFGAFLADHVGEAAKAIPIDVLSMLYQAWDYERKGAGEPGEGETSTSLEG
jgi:hypothetical protein